MTYANNYANRTTIFDTGDVIEGDHIKSIYDELGESPSRIFEGLGVPYKAGTWWNSAQSFASNSAKVNGTMNMWPVVLTRSIMFDAISTYVTVAGSAGTVIRMGIYNADANGMPSTLVAGSEVTQDGTVVNSATVAGVAINVTLGRGRYYLALVAQGSGTMPTTATGATSLFSVNSGTPTNFTTLMSTRCCGFAITSISGALPTDVSSSTLVQTASGHACAVRMA